MTNVEFRQSLSKEQVKFLQDLYSEILIRVEDSLEMCGFSSYGDGITATTGLLSVAYAYKNLLVEDKLDERLYKCEQRLDNL